MGGKVSDWYLAIGERGNSVYARGLWVFEREAMIRKPKHSSEKGEYGDPPPRFLQCVHFLKCHFTKTIIKGFLRHTFFHAKSK